MRNLDRPTPYTASNLKLLFQVCNAFKAQCQGLAEALGCHPAKVTRLMTEQAMQPDDAETVAKYFRFPRGLEPLALFSPPMQFRLQLKRAAYGLYQPLKSGRDQMEDLPVTPGLFIPEELMQLLSRTDSYRSSLGGQADGARDVPSASGEIGERYGIAVEVSGGPVAEAVRQGQAHAILVHVQRDVDQATVHFTRESDAIRPLSWLFAKPVPRDPDEYGDADEPDAPPAALALLVNPQPVGPRRRLGYPIGGTPGLRDVYVFLFAMRPDPGPSWHGAKDGQELTDDMAKSLVAYAGRVQLGRSHTSHMVYAAVAAKQPGGG
jgi:hypothetical protein